MATTKIATFFLLALCARSVTCMASEISHACSAQGDSNGGMLAQAWIELKTALERTPAERQRLTQLRLDFSDLALENKKLIATIEEVVSQQSVPDWLKARVEEIPEVQRRVSILLDRITTEAQQGHLLAADPSLTGIRALLAGKRDTTLCELSNIPLPLPPGQLEKVKRLLSDLKQEEKAIQDLDAVFTRLIRESQALTT